MPEKSAELSVNPDRERLLWRAAACGSLNRLPVSVQFDGQDLASLSPAALRAKRKEFQMIFQDSFASLNPGMTVEQVLSEPLKIHNVGTGDSRDRRIGELLESVSLSTSLIHRKSSELSGGQQQRLGIARGLALKPRLLIADEPVSALDASVQAQILNLLGDLKRQYDLTLILISHSLHAVHYLCTHISVLYKGRLVEEAPAPSFFREPKHPYSRILLESHARPGTAQEESTLPPLQAMDPSSASTLSGCAFYAYCPHRLPVCREQVPPLSETVSAGKSRLLPVCNKNKTFDLHPGICNLEFRNLESLERGIIAPASSNAQVIPVWNGYRNPAIFPIDARIGGIVAQEILSPEFCRNSQKNIVKIAGFVGHKGIAARFLCQ